MTGPGDLNGSPTRVEHALGSMRMDVVGGEHRDPAMAMLGTLPGEERSAEGDRGGDALQAARGAGVVLQGLELRLGERLPEAVDDETKNIILLEAARGNIKPYYLSLTFKTLHGQEWFPSMS